MDGHPDPSLETLVARWPVACSLSDHLPVGDLIALSRLSTRLRDLLHGFESPPPPASQTSLVKTSENVTVGESNSESEASTVARDLHIGHHGTKYWDRLKARAAFECCSATHTKGPPPRPCLFCSKPICEACIVRSSFARGHENTFQNRTRYLCKTCWDDGTPSRSRRFPLRPRPGHEDPTASSRTGYDAHGGSKDCCRCTLKERGWLCLDCKDRQNWEAISSADTHCHGKDCQAPLDADSDRRRICLWCDKALPSHLGGTTRHHWNQKMIEARARNAASRQADLQEYNRQRLQRLRMSRRDLRGDGAVQNDRDADRPQFVRHLDTVNYRRYMPESAAPSGDAIYDSKRGYWRYSESFLLKMRPFCTNVPIGAQVAASLSPRAQGALHFARTNAGKADDLRHWMMMVPSMPESRRREWWHLKAVILQFLHVDALDWESVQQVMRDDYDFDATIHEYQRVSHLWYLQHRLRTRHRDASDDGATTMLPVTGARADDGHVDPWTTAGTGDAFSPLVTTLNAAHETDCGMPRPPDCDETDSWSDKKLLDDWTQNAALVPMDGPLDAPPTTDDDAPLLPNTLDNLEGNSALDEIHDEDPPPYAAEGWIWP